MMLKVKMNQTSPISQHQQKGEGVLQIIFWVVGIIVGLLTIANFALPYVQGKSGDGINNGTKQTEKAGITEETQPAQVISEKASNDGKKIPSTKMDHYTAYANGTAVDNNTGMMWMRCSLGQEWNGTTCTGDAKKYSLEEAYQAIEQLNHTGYAGLYGWELPHIEDMYSLVFCSNGYKDSYDIADKSGQMITVDVECAGNHQKPTINGNAFPNTETALLHGYWSSTLNENGKPLVVYFNTGKIKAKSKTHYLRPIRSVQ
ncbi:MAG: hypothetical protein CR966_01660 [Pseudomonadales bacterium]|nr:MAG: hypothetical protein CR966_01660 [Pseudomonadales bacterium]